MTQRPTLDNLTDVIRKGENEYLEFKTRFTSEAAIARPLVAFANSDGGILLIGVAETTHGGEVRGLTEAEATQTLDRLRRLTQSLLPTPVQVGSLELDGRTVAYASVSPLPAHLRPLTTATGEAYQREFDRDVQLTPEPVLVVEREPGEESQRVPYRIFVAMSSTRKRSRPWSTTDARWSEPLSRFIQPVLSWCA